MFQTYIPHRDLVREQVVQATAELYGCDASLISESTGIPHFGERRNRLMMRFLADPVTLSVGRTCAALTVGELIHDLATNGQPVW